MFLERLSRTQKRNPPTPLGDVQLRNVAYRFTKEADIIHALNKVGHHFIQPKLGFHWQVDKHIQFLFSGLHSENLTGTIMSMRIRLCLNLERLLDHELGLRLHGTALQVEQKFYSMNYRNQLVPTGKLNDVGSYVWSNVARSFRTGSETTISWDSPAHNIISIKF